MLVTYGSNGAWRRRFLTVADVVDRRPRAADIEARYEAVLADLPDEVRSLRVAFVRPGSDDQFVVDSGAAAFAGSVARDARIPTLDPRGVGELDKSSGFVTVSGERMRILDDAGLIVVATYAADDERAGALERNPLWRRLSAVRAGRVVELPNPVYNGGSHYAAELLLAKIAEATA